jgi:hypothetical protein
MFLADRITESGKPFLTSGGSKPGAIGWLGDINFFDACSAVLKPQLLVISTCEQLLREITATVSICAHARFRTGFPLGKPRKQLCGNINSKRLRGAAAKAAFV